MSQLEPILAPVVEAAGFKLVRLRLIGGKKKTLQVMAEREDPIEGDFELEVSSPGIDRPLTRLTDFARWSGHEAKIELAAPLDGRKRLRALLLGLDGSEVVVDAHGERLKFPFRAIAEAKLVLSEKLIQEDLKARKQ